MTDHFSLLMIFSDVSRVQVGAYFKTYFKSQACNDAIVCFKIAENADEVSGSAVEKDEHENH